MFRIGSISSTADRDRRDRRRRRAALLPGAIALLVMAACQPVDAEPGGPAPADGVTVSTATPARGDTVDVTIAGCDDRDSMQYQEVRLVVGHGAKRHSAAIVTGVGEASIVVPQWVPSGSATVEVACLEPNFSGASDGVDVFLFDYEPVPVSIVRRPRRDSSGRLDVERVVKDGSLHVSGAGCTGTVIVRVARGSDLVGSGQRFHYQGEAVTAGPDGRWEADVALVYAVSYLRNPIAPGPMSVFASCDGVSYKPERFRISAKSPAPAIQPQSQFDPSFLYLGQCHFENQLVVTTRVTLGDGTVQTITDVQPGQDYGERILTLPLPGGVVSASYSAVCRGPVKPSFTYAPVSYPFTPPTDN